MRRHGASKNTDMRKRTTIKLPLTGEEIEEIRQAYRDGCKGEIIIELRGNEQVIKMLVPAQGYNSSGCDVTAMEDHLRNSGCDGFIRISGDTQQLTRLIGMPN